MPCPLAKPSAGLQHTELQGCQNLSVGRNQELSNPPHVVSSRSSIRPIPLSWPMLQRANDADSKGEKGSAPEPLAPSALSSPSSSLPQPGSSSTTHYVPSWYLVSSHEAQIQLSEGPSHSMDLSLSDEGEWRAG